LGASPGGVCCWRINAGKRKAAVRWEEIYDGGGMPLVVAWQVTQRVGFEDEHVRGVAQTLPIIHNATIGAHRHVDNVVHMALAAR
jgi:hypothetical protein